MTATAFFMGLILGFLAFPTALWIQHWLRGRTE